LLRLFAESCIRKAVAEGGLDSSSVGLADASSEGEAATGIAFASEESCIRKAMSKRGFNSSPVGLANAKAEDEAASRWADCAVAYGD
jgi:hypothetical protein